MATSGSTNYSETRNQIAEAILRKCGQLAEGETATAQQINDVATEMERLVKAWQAKGLHLWKYEEVVVFLEVGKQQFALGPTGDRAVLKDDLVTTAVKVAGESTDTTVDVDSITGIASGDFIGVVMDDTTIHWTTVNGAPAGDTITLTAALDGVASVGNKVYAFTAKASRPLQITHARVQVTATSETILNIDGREDYFSLANKGAAGTPVEIYYNPSLTNGKLYVYPTVTDERQYLNLTVQMPIEDFDSASNSPDLPIEWHQALIWNCAKHVAIEYGVDDATWTKIVFMAESTLQDVSDFDTESADIIWVADLSGA